MTSTLRFRIGGMTCARCAARVEERVSALAGVEAATVNYATSILSVRLASAAVTPSSVAERVREAGYRALAPDATEDEQRELVLLRVRLAVAVFFSMNAMLPATAVYLGVGAPPGSRPAWWLALATGVLSVPVVFCAGWPFLAGAWRSVRARAPGMDLLVSSGALATFAYSTFVLATGGSDVYFDTASGIVTFLLVGRLLERIVRRRSLDAVRLLQRLVPETTRVLGADGTQSDAPTLRVRRAARIVVAPGERIPLDGSVTLGKAHVDGSLLTGESEPRSVSAGDTVEAGSLCIDGTLTVEVTKVAGERAVDFIATAVDELLGHRAPLQTLADRVASRLTIAVLAASALTAAGVWWSTSNVTLTLMRAVAVAVVACPCALGLATPMAVLVAAGAGARRGILFRDAATIERLAGVDTVFFDKTGTLTEGRPVVVEVVAARGSSPEEVLALASLAEHGSTHPLASAVLAAKPVAGPPRGIVRQVAGEGVELTRDDGSMIRVGRASFVADHTPDGTERPMATEAHVSRDGIWLGLLRISDGVRAESPAVVSSLFERGFDVAMVSGDHQAAARSVAARVGILQVHADSRPLEKCALVQAACTSGASVAFVGDGLNDAAALAAATVGIAMSDATDVARAAAGVVLRGGSLWRVLDALELARRTRRIMRQNVGWSLVYNAIAVPAAMTGLVSPSLAALAMALSSVSVIGNSLRLAASDSSTTGGEATERSRPPRRPGSTGRAPGRARGCSAVHRA